MTATTTYLDKTTANLLINQSIDNVNAKFEAIKIAMSSNLVPIDKKSYHFIAELLNKVEPSNNVEIMLNLLATNIIYRSEVMSQSAGLATFVYFFNLYSNLTKSFGDKIPNEVALSESYQVIIEEITNLILSENRIAKEKDLQNLINEICVLFESSMN